MRDINRIEPFLNKIKEIWTLHPDWRFGQLIANILGIHGNTCSIDPFYYEEDKFLELLNKYNYE